MTSATICFRFCLYILMNISILLTLYLNPIELINSENSGKMKSVALSLFNDEINIGCGAKRTFLYSLTITKEVSKCFPEDDCNEAELDMGGHDHNYNQQTTTTSSTNGKFKKDISNNSDENCIGMREASLKNLISLVRDKCHNRPNCEIKHEDIMSIIKPGAPCSEIFDKREILKLNYTCTDDMETERANSRMVSTNHGDDMNIFNVFHTKSPQGITLFHDFQNATEKRTVNKTMGDVENMLGKGRFVSPVEGAAPSGACSFAVFWGHSQSYIQYYCFLFGSLLLIYIQQCGCTL